MSMATSDFDAKAPRRRGPRWLFVGGAMVVVLCCTVWIWNSRRHAPAPPRLQIDAGQLHPRVAEVITRAIGEVGEDSSSGPKWGNLGMLCMAHGLEDQALVCFAEAARLEPEEFRWRYLPATMFELSDLEEASRRFGEAAELRLDYAPLRYRWGNVQMRLDRLTEARDNFATAAKLEPRSPFPQVGLGRAAQAEGNDRKALEHFEAAAQLAPWSSAVQRALVQIYTLEGKLDLAFRAQQQAARMPATTEMMPDPVYEEVLDMQVLGKQLARMADRWFAGGDLRRAERAYREMIQERPDLARPGINLAHVLEQQGNYAGAVDLYRNVIKRFPEETLAHESLAYALEQTGDLEGAAESFKRCVALKPDYAQALFGLGLLEKKRGHAEEALAAFRRAVEADPKLAPAQLSLGIELLESGQVEPATEHMQRAVQLAPNDPVPLGYLKEALEKRAAADQKSAADK